MNLPGNPQSDSFQSAQHDGRLSHFDASPETTLRMIAQSPVPVGLEERIQARLRAQMRAGIQPTARVLAWPSIPGQRTVRMGSAALRTAAAAAIVAVVLGGGWGIASRIQPAFSSRGVTAPVRAIGPGGFSSAGAMRTPQTFNGPIIAPAEHAQTQNRDAAKSPVTRKAKSAASVRKSGMTVNQAAGLAK